MLFLSDIEKIAFNTPIVVANLRQKRGLENYYNKNRLAEKKTWLAPSIMDWRGFLKWSFKKKQYQHNHILLSDLQVWVVWFNLLYKKSKEEQTSLLTDKYIKIYKKISVNNLSLEELALDDFSSCYEKYKKYLSDNKFSDSYANSYFLIDNKIYPDSFYIGGFSKLTPEQKYFFEKTSPQKLVLQKKITHSVKKEKFISIDEQLTSAIGWCLDNLKNNKSGKCALVVPNLANKLKQIIHIFEKIQNNNLLEESHNKVYEVFLTNSLKHTLLIDSILSTVYFCYCVAQNNVPVKLLIKILANPYTDNSEFIGSVKKQVTAKNINFLSKKQINEIFANTSFNEIIKALPDNKKWQQKSYYDWVAFITNVLEVFSWGKNKILNSSDYQILEKWYDVCHNISSLDNICDVCEFDVFNTGINTLLSDTYFQPKSSQQSLYIIDASDITNLYFDSAWVVGLDENFDNYIMKKLANDDMSLLGGRISENYNNYLKNYVYDLETLASDLVFSYSETDEEGFFVNVSSSFDFSSVKTCKKYYSNINLQLEYLTDYKANKIKNTNIKSGISVLNNQLDCSFKGFSSRLGISSTNIEFFGISPMQKGNYFHYIMESVWQKILCSSNVEKFINDESKINSIVNGVIKENSNISFTNKLLLLEKNRLINLVKRVLRFDIENRKTDFLVLHREYKTNTSVGELNFDIKIDRVDKLNDGKIVIIDYKTGSTTPTIKEKITNVQIPIYVFKFNENNLWECLYLKANEEKISFSGISKNKLSQKEWDNYLQKWRKQLLDISEKFQNGLAMALPINKNVCNNCSLMPLCRINEL